METVFIIISRKLKKRTTFHFSSLTPHCLLLLQNLIFRFKRLLFWVGLIDEYSLALRSVNEKVEEVVGKLTETNLDMSFRLFSCTVYVRYELVNIISINATVY